MEPPNVLKICKIIHCILFQYISNLSFFYFIKFIYCLYILFIQHKIHLKKSNCMDQNKQKQNRHGFSNERCQSFIYLELFYYIKTNKKICNEKLSNFSLYYYLFKQFVCFEQKFPLQKNQYNYTFRQINSIQKRFFNFNSHFPGINYFIKNI